MGAKKKDGPEPDRHKGGTMTRIPNVVFAPIRELARQKGRPITWEIREALLDWIAAGGKPRK